MEAFRSQILTRLMKGRPPHEVSYLNSLFGMACPNSENISGSDVVAFFKKSKVEMVSISMFEREIELYLLLYRAH